MSNVTAAVRRWYALLAASEVGLQELNQLSFCVQVPITYVNEVGWQQEILRFAPTLLLIGAYIYITRRTMGGGLGGAGGLGGGGGRNIFNVGKAQVCDTKQPRIRDQKLCA